VIELADGERVAVIAGSYAQACRWIHDQGLPRSRMIYVAGLHSLRGLARGLKYAMVGTWYDRYRMEELAEMRARLAMLEARQVF
jgi:hypothetical protein